MAFSDYSPSPSPSLPPPLLSAASQSVSLGSPLTRSRLPAPPYYHPLPASLRPSTPSSSPAEFPVPSSPTTNMFFTQPSFRTLACAALSLTLLLLFLYPTSLAQHFSDPQSQRPHGLIFESDSSLSSLNLNVISSETLDSSSSSTTTTSTTNFFKPPLSKIEIERRILNAAPILGYFEESNGSIISPTSSNSDTDQINDLSNWMSKIPDQIQLTEINIPGTHDSATWNYTKSTQLQLEPITGKLPPSIAYQCQDRSLFRMLGDGIRFFDLRVGYLPGHQQLGFYHAAALLSTTATVEDVFLGFYKWLDAHPTETVLISIKVDNATYGVPSSPKQPSSVGLQEMLYELLTQDELGKKYWLQQDKALGTLGEARGKLIFIQRIDWTSIRSRPSTRPIGIPLPPAEFKDNVAFFSVVYNKATGATALIEDLYNLPLSSQPVKKSIEVKFKAIVDHLEKAGCRKKDKEEEEEEDHDGGAGNQQLFITFTSGGALKNLPPVTPKLLALGTNSILGINQRLKQFLQTDSNHHQQEVYDCQSLNQTLVSSSSSSSSSRSSGSGSGSGSGKRLGIVILDWYASVDGLVEEILRKSY